MVLEYSLSMLINPNMQFNVLILWTMHWNLIQQTQIKKFTKEGTKFLMQLLYFNSTIIFDSQIFYFLCKFCRTQKIKKKNKTYEK